MPAAQLCHREPLFSFFQEANDLFLAKRFFTSNLLSFGIELKVFLLLKSGGTSGHMISS